MHHRHQHSRKRGRKLSRPAYEDDNTALVMTNSFSTRATPAAGCCRNRNQAAAHTSKPSHAPGTSGHLRAPVLSWPGHAELPLTSQRGESVLRCCRTRRTATTAARPRSIALHHGSCHGSSCCAWTTNGQYSTPAPAYTVGDMAPRVSTMHAWRPLLLASTYIAGYS